MALRPSRPSRRSPRLASDLLLWWSAPAPSTSLASFAQTASALCHSCTLVCMYLVLPFTTSPCNNTALGVTSLAACLRSCFPRVPVPERVGHIPRNGTASQRECVYRPAAAQRLASWRRPGPHACVGEEGPRWGWRAAIFCSRFACAWPQRLVRQDGGPMARSEAKDRTAWMSGACLVSSASAATAGLPMNLGARSQAAPPNHD